MILALFGRNQEMATPGKAAVAKHGPLEDYVRKSVTVQARRLTFLHFCLRIVQNQN